MTRKQRRRAYQERLVLRLERQPEDAAWTDGSQTEYELAMLLTLAAHTERVVQLTRDVMADALLLATVGVEPVPDRLLHSVRVAES